MSNQENTSEWITLHKEKGTVYYGLSPLIIGFGIFLLLLGVYYYFVYFDLVYTLLMFIGAFLIWNGYTTIKTTKKSKLNEEGFIRFNREKVELVLGGNVVEEIPLDKNTFIEPICNDFLGGYHKLWGICLVYGKKRIAIEPNDGYSMEEIREKVPLLIEYAKKKGAKFHKYWKHIKY